VSPWERLREHCTGVDMATLPLLSRSSALNQFLLGNCKYVKFYKYPYFNFITLLIAELDELDPMLDKSTCLICWVRPQLFNVLPSKSLRGKILRLYLLEESEPDDLNLLL